MNRKVFILTNDNVLFLLLNAYIRAQSSAIECQKITSHHNFDFSEVLTSSIILVDGKMTLISPLELIYKLRYEMKITSPVWLLSEINTSAYIEKAIQLGANKIIKKPFDPIDLAYETAFFVLKQKPSSN